MGESDRPGSRNNGTRFFNRPAAKPCFRSHSHHRHLKVVAWPPLCIFSGPRQHSAAENHLLSTFVRTNVGPSKYTCCTKYTYYLRKPRFMKSLLHASPSTETPSPPPSSLAFCSAYTNVTGCVPRLVSTDTSAAKRSKSTISPLSIFTHAPSERK